MGAAAGPDIIENGLVLCLDAASRQSYAGSGTVWRDLAGSNNGALTNGPTFSSANGGSVVFDGVDDFVNLGNILKFTRTQEASISVWFSISSFSNVNFLIARRSTGGNRTDYALAIKNSNTVSYLFDDDARTGINGGNPTFYDWQVPTLYIGLWYNFTINLLNNGSWGRVTGFFNGQFLNSQDGPHDDYVSNELVLGRNQIVTVGPPIYFNGKISKVSIYNRALTPIEILQNYNATKGRFSLT
jgi:hypothetical protein